MTLNILIDNMLSFIKKNVSSTLYFLKLKKFQLLQQVLRFNINLGFLVTVKTFGKKTKKFDSFTVE